MDWELFTSLLIAFGFGSCITAVIQYFLTKEFKREEILFNARCEIYGNLMGRLRSGVIVGEERYSFPCEDIDVLISQAKIVAGDDLDVELTELGSYIYDSRAIVQNVTNPQDLLRRASFNDFITNIVKRIRKIDSLIKSELIVIKKSKVEKL